jgi:hypothetical protein
VRQPAAQAARGRRGPTVEQSRQGGRPDAGWTLVDPQPIRHDWIVTP